MYARWPRHLIRSTEELEEGTVASSVEENTTADELMIAQLCREILLLLVLSHYGLL